MVICDRQLDEWGGSVRLKRLKDVAKGSGRRDLVGLPVRGGSGR